MNKNVLCSLLSKRTNLSKEKCNQFLSTFKETILEVVSKGEEISLRDFGKFSLQERKSRKFINPQTKRFYMSAPKKLVTFKSFKNFNLS